jgi:hypothetical protein
MAILYNVYRLISNIKNTMCLHFEVNFELMISSQGLNPDFGLKLVVRT